MSRSELNPPAPPNPAAADINQKAATLAGYFNYHRLDDTAVVLAYVTEELKTVLEWATPTLTELVRDALAIIEADLRDGRETRNGIDAFQACLEMHDRTKVPQPQDHRIAITLSRAELTTVCRLRLGRGPQMRDFNLVENGDIVAMCVWLAVHQPDFFSEALRPQILLAHRRFEERRGSPAKSKVPMKFHFTKEQKLKILDLAERMTPRGTKTAVIEKEISETVRYHTANGPEHVKNWTTSPVGLSPNSFRGIEKLPPEPIDVSPALLPALDQLVARFSSAFRSYSRQDLILQLGLPLVEECLPAKPQVEPEPAARLEPIRFYPYLASPLVARQTPRLLCGTPPADAGPSAAAIRRLEAIPAETPVLMDACLVALAIAGGTNRLPFSKQAAAFLDLRIQHNPELALSASEVPKLFEWLNRLEAAPATNTPRADWLHKLLADLGLCFRILVPNEADAAEAASRQLPPAYAGPDPFEAFLALWPSECRRGNRTATEFRAFPTVFRWRQPPTGSSTSFRPRPPRPRPGSACLNAGERTACFRRSAPCGCIRAALR